MIGARNTKPLSRWTKEESTPAEAGVQRHSERKVRLRPWGATRETFNSGSETSLTHRSEHECWKPDPLGMQWWCNRTEAFVDKGGQALAREVVERNLMTRCGRSLTTSSPTTTSQSSNTPHLSQRALEKRPVRDHDEQSLAHAGQQAFDDPVPPPRAAHSHTQPRYRTSFLQTFLARQQNRDATSTSAVANTSQVLNPINHIPRPTLVQLPSTRSADLVDEFAPGERHTLLTLPEQRRSRSNSPNTPTFQESFVQDREHSHRTSIGLPSNHRPSVHSHHSNQLSMARSEQYFPSSPSTTKSPTKKRDHNPVVDTSPPEVASTYGFSEADQPAHPPRRISSQNSLHHERSAASIRSPAFDQASPGALPQLSQSGPQPAGNASSQQATHLEEGQQQGFDEEPQWGPSHPCFDHMNPHVPLNSPEYKSTRVIRIRRDWMAHGDLAPAYSNIYPEILDHLLPEDEFRHIIDHINTTLARAYNPFSVWNWLDGAVGLLTGWLWEDLRRGGIKGELRNLDKWIETWNRKVGAADKEKVKIIPLRRTGYMCLDIQIPDPGVHVIDPNVREEDNSTPRPTTQNTMRTPAS